MSFVEDDEGTVASGSRLIHSKSDLPSAPTQSTLISLPLSSANPSDQTAKQKLATMVCPFAYLAGRTGIARSGPPSGHPKPQSSSASASYDVESLTGMMKAATWATHRDLERSHGVSALMGRSSNANQLARIDYLRFLIMLLCLYSTMESIILTDSSSPLNVITRDLQRSDTLLRDIQAHLNELAGVQQDETARISDLYLDVEIDAHRSSSLYVRLFQTVKAALDALSTCSHAFFSTTFDLSFEHILLLTIDQANAIWAYVEVLQSTGQGTVNHYDEGISLTPMQQECSPFEALSSSDPTATSPATTIRKYSPGAPRTTGNSISPYNHLIIAHAYVRYMGDLSGGQHMSKRLAKLFPIFDTDEGRGFEFYTFATPARLKSNLRTIIDKLDLDNTLTTRITQEAVIAFDLHHAIFASLIPATSDYGNTSDSTFPLPGSLRATAAASA